jgi:hypothetical protein
LTTQQIEELAARHSRALRPVSPLEQTETLAQTPAASISWKEETHPTGVGPALPPHEEESRLFQKVITLETRVAQLSDQLAGLAMHLLQQRDHTLERRLSTLGTALYWMQGGSPSFSLSPQSASGLAQEPPPAREEPTRPPHPAEARSRERRPPLIEYYQGRYVLVSSQEGELDVEPDSLEWFAWLASLSSFRFVGKPGRFSACRDCAHGQ